MRILAMTPGDFRTADSGGRLREYYMCSALARLGDLDVLTFEPHQSSAGAPRKLDANVIIEKKPSRAGTLIASLAAGESYHGRLFDPRHHSGFERLLSERYDVIYCSFWYSIEAARELVRAGSKAALVVWDTHNYDPDVWSEMSSSSRGLRSAFASRQKRAVMEATDRAALAADVVIAATESDAESLRRHTRNGSIVVVPNGGETVRWAECSVRSYAKPSSCVIFGGLAQDSTRRGVEWFLDEVWPGLLAGNEERTIVVAGRGPSRALARTVANTPQARLVADPSDIAPVVAAAEVIAIPQIWGTGSKIKMIEAVATGRRVVASPAATIGMPESLLRYVDIADEAAAWTDAIVDAFEDPLSPADVEERRRAAEAFDWSTGSDLLEKILRDRLA